MQRALAPLVLAAILVTSSLYAAKIPVSGRVVDPGGKAVAGGKVFLVPVPTTAERARLELAGKTAEPAVTAATDAAGAFQLAAPDAGMWRVRIDARGFVPLEMPLIPLVDETDLGEVKMLADTGIKVTVTGPEGKPAAGARVRLVDARAGSGFGGSWSVAPRLATTGADGTATLPGRPRRASP